MNLQTTCSNIDGFDPIETLSSDLYEASDKRIRLWIVDTKEL